MGAGGSKQQGSGPAKHIFSSETPFQFSQDFVQQLQSSSETDASRAQSLELHIQNRVAQELERIQKREAQTLADLEKRLGESNSPAEVNETSKQVPALPELTLESPRIPFAGPGNFREVEALAAKGGLATETTDAANATTPYRSLTSQSLSQQITDLKTRLAARPGARELDPTVQESRQELVNCLKSNDKRPLLCWEQVEQFKEQVSRLQQKWVDKVVA
ncbi:DEAD-box type RNA helicase [Ascosphaera pollenicola]|nr:DEAD-box type RNA helicase [Ascosphaera pollenicola]